MIKSLRRPSRWRLCATVVLTTVALLSAGCGFDRDAPVAHPSPPASDPGSVATGTAGSDTAGSDTAASDTGPGPAKLSGWRGCKDGFECATLTVPLDWSQPKGRTIKLAVGRLKAKGPGKRIGSVLFNPGGPGASGVSFLRDAVKANRLPKALNQRLDLVAWDPRGTGHSARVDCTSVEQLKQPDPDPTPDNPAEAAAVDLKLRQNRADCSKQSGPLLTAVGTAETVRDLDALRHAVGDAKLTFVGFSYGTTIGIEYARRYRSHVRALVLDGVAIPGDDPIEASHRQGLSFEKALQTFLADCAKRPTCQFGNGDPFSALQRLIAALDAGLRMPAHYDFGALKRDGTLGIGELYVALVQAMYDRELWSVLEIALAHATDPTTPDGGELLLLRDFYTGLQENGTWDDLADANTAINCDDTPVRGSDAVGDPALRVRWSQEMPLLGGVFSAGEPPCFLFPPAVEPLTRPAAGSLTGLPPVAIISTTGDPATPYEQGLTLQKIIPSSVVITWDSTEHTAYGRGSKCIDGPVTAYLVDLQPLRPGVTCKPT